MTQMPTINEMGIYKVYRAVCENRISSLVIDKHESGMTISEIAQMFSMPSYKVREILGENGIEFNSRYAEFPELTPGKLMEMIRSGMTLTQISEKYGCDRSTMYNRIYDSKYRAEYSTISPRRNKGTYLSNFDLTPEVIMEKLRAGEKLHAIAKQHGTYSSCLKQRIKNSPYIEEYNRLTQRRNCKDGQSPDTE